MFTKEKFPITLFVSASIMAFILFFLLFLFFSFYSSLSSTSVVFDNNNSNVRYFLKDDMSTKDPMMTKVLNLSDYLSGPIINNSDPSIGQKDSPVNIVIYSDFKCEYCANQEKVIRKVLDEYRDRIRFIWKDYPEAKLDADSFQASVAARCAQAQGAFWNYHDLLFDREEALNEKNFYQIAQDLDLDMVNFKDCFVNQKTRNLIIDDMTEAEALGIDGIPFMYVNDQQLVGELNYDDLKKVIDIQLEKSE